MPIDDQLPIDPDLGPGDPGGPRFATPHPPGESTRPRRTRPDVLAVIALGGLLGTLARAALGRIRPTPAGHLPVTTLSINLTGALALGFLMVLLVERFGPAPRLRPFLTTGVLGGFTTFSTFMVETTQLFQHGHVGVAMAYLAVSAIGGVGAALVGIAIAHRCLPSGGPVSDLGSATLVDHDGTAR